MFAPTTSQWKILEVLESKQEAAQMDLLALPCQTLFGEVPSLTPAALRALTLKYAAVSAMLRSCWLDGGHMTIAKGNRVTED